MAAKADGCNARAIEEAVSVRQSGFNNFFIKTLDIDLIMLVRFYMRKFRGGTYKSAVRFAKLRYYVAVAQRPKFNQNHTKMPLFR